MLIMFESLWVNLFLFVSFLVSFTSVFSSFFDHKVSGTLAINDRYENKYIKSLEFIKTRDLTDNELLQLKNNILLENTPMGNIVLFYNHEQKRFEFYSDRKDVPYKFLNAAVQKYVKIYNCKKIYIDLDTELDLSKQKYEDLLEKKKTETDKLDDKKKDVFVAYKNYNMKTDTPNKKEDYLIKENINHFKWIGFLKDYPFLKSPEKKSDELSFQDFVKIQSST